MNYINPLICYLKHGKNQNIFFCIYLALTYLLQNGMTFPWPLVQIPRVFHVNEERFQFP